MAYFRVTQKQSGGGGGGATITVSYSSSFYNKTITCSDGTTTYTATTTSSGSTTFNVNAEGTWTIICDGKTTSVDVVLEYEATIAPDGSTVLPTDDIQTWLACASISDKSYTTIDEVLDDSTTLLALMSDNNAIDYLVRSTTWATDVCTDSTAMTDIGANNYCADTLLADADWCDAISDSQYIESVLNVKVPTMTGDTTPSGQVIYSGQYSGQSAYKVFDKNASTTWSNSAANYSAYIGYKFTRSVKCVAGFFTQRNSSSIGACTAKFQGSNDGFSSEAEDLTNTLSFDTMSSPQETLKFLFNIDDTYDSYRLQFISGPSNTYPTCAELQFYGRVDV